MILQVNPNAQSMGRMEPATGGSCLATQEAEIRRTAV
jgi:hypothetical protein